MAAGSDASRDKKKSVSLQPGAVIWCKTQFNQEFQGEVMAYDEDSGSVILKTLSTKPQQKVLYDVSVVNLKLIDESNFRLISVAKGELPSLPDIDRTKIAKRLKQAKERVGIGVSIEAQQLFDFIHKRISECYWSGQNIQVLDDVKISPPYQKQNCCGINSQTVIYIQSIVEKFYEDSPSSIQPIATPVTT